ncbi:hypothetical protein ACKWTF_015980 [Chironomus riparius]
MKNAVFLVCLLLTFISSLSSTNVTCTYRTSTFWAAESMYNCYVANTLDIYQPEDAVIISATGIHSYGESSDSEVVFYTYNKNVHFFPLGLEKIYKNLNGIILYTEPIDFIQQSDLKAYTKLIFIQLADTKIEILEDGLFDYNPQLKYLALNENKIFHIGLTVFENLNNLISLNLDKNVCIKRKSEKSKSSTLELIKLVKSQCMSNEFFGIDEKFLKLEKQVENLNHKNFGIFEKELLRLESRFVRSKFANFTLLQEKLEKLKEAKVEKHEKSNKGANMTGINLILLILCFLRNFL